MTAAEWTAIAEACERATGPDADIDWRIALALGGAKLKAAEGTMEHAHAFVAAQEAVEPIPYTASLDAITAAIDERFPDWRWSAHRRDSPKGKATGEGYIHNNELFVSGARKSFDVFAATPALALCAALARAVAAKEGA